MNGANAEPCVAISSTPNTSSMTKRGSSQSFCRTFKNWQNSLRDDMSSFQEPVYTEEAVFRMPPLCWRTLSGQCRHECRHGRLERPMSYSFPITGHLYKLWGGPPGPQPTPSSACSGLDETDLLGKERIQGGTRADQGSAPQFMQDSQFRENYMKIG